MFISLAGANAQWTYQNVPSGIGIVLTIDFTDLQNGSAGGWIMFQNQPSGRAIYTTNAGLNWILAQVPDTTRAFVTIQFVNSQTGYCAGAYNSTVVNATKREPLLDINDYYGRVIYKQKYPLKNIPIGGLNQRGLFLKTTNQGHSWFTYGTLPPNIFYLVGLHFINSNTGFVTASLRNGSLGDGILKTTDGGINWNILTLPDSIDYLRKIYFTDLNTGFAAGFDEANDTSRGVILRTTNSGLTWSKQTFMITNGFEDFHFTDSTTGFAVSNSGFINYFGGAVYKTTNTGFNWIRLQLQIGEVELFGIEFVNPSGTGIIFGLDPTSPKLFISRTTNYGVSWINQIINDSSNIFIGSRLLSQSNWYLGGGDIFSRAVILHTTNGGAIGIEPVSTEIPEKFKLYQNYPNPFNPVTKIRFDIPNFGFRIGGFGFVNLKVYDILGREIAVLVNEELQPGTYEVDFDGTNYTSGVYFYKLEAGDFIETRKMVLIK